MGKPLVLQRYRDHSGNSGVVAYACVPDGLVVEFRSGDTYLYTAASAGAQHLAAMLRLARAGQGLSGYISRHVRTGYARKLR